MSRLSPGLSRSAELRAVGMRLSSTPLRRGAVLTAVILMLQLLVFLTSYTGRTIPPWDFLGAYAGEAYVWWTDGNLFNHLDWIPYVLGGYPSDTSLQNSGWYLPTGFMTLFGPYTLHMAAILAALHVAFGSYGMYFLLRGFRAGFGVALFAAVSIFFGVGFYSNASHIDIARSYAWLPWVLLLLSPLWKWDRWWSIPVASLLLWQALTGVYPGTLIAAVYVLVPWIIVLCVIYRPRFTAFLLPLAISALVALLLSMPRLVPYAMLDDGGETTGTGDASLFSPSLLGTVLFGYGIQYNGLPNDVTMRSFFIPVTVLMLALFARWSDPLCRAALALGIPSFVLGMPFFPWFQTEQSLPGLGLSRFTMSDYKLFLVGAAILLACSGLRTLTVGADAGSRRRGDLVSLVLGWFLLAGFSLAAAVGPQGKRDTLPPLALLTLTLAILTAVVILRRRQKISVDVPVRRFRMRPVALLSACIALTVISGTVWAYSTPGPWRVDRIEAEQGTFGDTIDHLIAKRADVSEQMSQRPARAPLSPGYTPQTLLSASGNAAFYSGEYSLPAYVNLKRAESQRRLERTLLDSSIRDEFAAYMALPGTVLAVAADGSISSEILTACIEMDQCGVDARPLAYVAGSYSYRISLETPTVVNLNESFYPGWSAEACTRAGQCTTLAPELSPYGTIQIALPAGDFDLALRYTTPGRGLGYGLFAGGLAILLGATITICMTRRRKEVTENVS